MRNKKKPVFRLTVIFIAVVIGSGGILAYLSITNISNLKELTEKRVLEEQENLVAAISDQLLSEISSTEQSCQKSFSVSQLDGIAAQVNFDTLQLIGNSFMLYNNGRFIWPNFTEDLNHNDPQVTSAKFLRNFSRAERAEFIEEDLENSHRYYLASLGTAPGTQDSAKTLNALARISVKMNYNERALDYYSTIISHYYQLTDRKGFPYVYYAILQLIRISDDAIKDRVDQEIRFCIPHLYTGDTPLNQSTESILDLVAEHMETGSGNNEWISDLLQSIQEIKTRLDFMERNADLIRQFLHERSIEDQLNVEDFQIINGNTPDRTELILISTRAEQPYGFSMNLEKLWYSILKNGIEANLEFEYEIELVIKANGQNSQKTKLTTKADISPLFPGFQVLIRMDNEDLIDKLVSKRSWIYGIALTLLLGGMVLGILLIMRDISREEHLALLRADFISNVTHELKTPLTSIQLFTESILLNRIKSAAHKKDYLQIILKETGNLKRMVNNILDFSSMEKGRREYHFETVNVTLLLNNAINDLDYWLMEKNFTLVKEIDDHVTAMADPGALTQAIVNLLNNAIKFSRKRKEIIVRLTKEEEIILIQVEDKGIGIPEDQKDLIFQPFYRVGQKNSEDIGGTGLGLSMVKEIVNAHQGKIRVESQLNEGSTFTILFKSPKENSG